MPARVSKDADSDGVNDRGRRRPGYLARRGAALAQPRPGTGKAVVLGGERRGQAGCVGAGATARGQGNGRRAVVSQWRCLRVWGARRRDRGPPAGANSGSPEHLRTHGGFLCQEGVVDWPGDRLVIVGLGGLFFWLSSQVPGFVLPRGPGPAGAPGAWAPARAPGEDERAGGGQAAADDRERGRACWFRGRWVWGVGGLASRCAWWSEWSHMHPSGTCLGWRAP
jgi:hypothetical protein